MISSPGFRPSDRQRAKEFWRESLAGFDQITPLPFRRPIAAVDAAAVRMGDAQRRLSAERTRQLADVAKQFRVTSNTLVQGAWALVLAAYANSDDVMFGVTVAGRPAELRDVGDTLGLFINTIPLRISLPVPEVRLSVAQWLQNLQAQNVTMREFEHTPLLEIQSLSEVPRGSALFDSLFVFENAPVDPQLEARRIETNADLVASRVHTNYPVTVAVVPGRELLLRISFDLRAFRQEDMDRILQSFHSSAGAAHRECSGAVVLSHASVRAGPNAVAGVAARPSY